MELKWHNPPIHQYYWGIGGLGDGIMELKWQVIVSPSSGVGQSPSTIGGLGDISHHR